MTISRRSFFNLYAIGIVFIISFCASTYAQEENYQKKYEDLVNEYDTLKKDRDNVLIQTKKLLEEKTVIADQSVELESIKREKIAIKSEKEAADAERRAMMEKNAALESQVKELSAKVKDLIDWQKKRESLAVEYEKEKSDGAVELKKANLILQNEVSKLKLDAVAVAQKLETGHRDKRILQTKIDDTAASNEALKKDIAAAAKKNRKFENELNKMPKKFTEIGRQNTALLRDTSKMHYNMGVFYIKNKEYNRAIAELEKSIDINPEDSQAYFNLGYVYAQYVVKREKAIQNFRQYLRYAKSNDKDIDWVKKYLLTWETYNANIPME